MSRTMNLNLPEADTVRRCEDAHVGISIVEPLPNGGTRLVCMTNGGAATMRRKLASHMLVGPQARFPFFVPQLQR